LLGQADRIYHSPMIAPAILDRARADAARIPLEGGDRPPEPPLPGLSLYLTRVRAF
jgi:uroporphyrin-III C-methyltransferase / precorrin-2 dehydrogenase / sirohydrochlorin ferrochelatase